MDCLAVGAWGPVPAVAPFHTRLMQVITQALFPTRPSRQDPARLLKFHVDWLLQGAPCVKVRLKVEGFLPTKLLPRQLSHAS